jgi:hypothetical protein
MFWTLELASYLEDAPWPATKDELIDYSIRSGAPIEVVENLQELEDEGEVYESIEDIWPDYPSQEDFMFKRRRILTTPRVPTAQRRSPKWLFLLSCLKGISHKRIVQLFQNTIALHQLNQPCCRKAWAFEKVAVATAPASGTAPNLTISFKTFLRK